MASLVTNKPIIYVFSLVLSLLITFSCITLLKINKIKLRPVIVNSYFYSTVSDFFYLSTSQLEATDEAGGVRNQRRNLITRYQGFLCSSTYIISLSLPIIYLFIYTPISLYMHFLFFLFRFFFFLLHFSFLSPLRLPSAPPLPGPSIYISTYLSIYLSIFFFFSIKVSFFIFNNFTFPFLRPSLHPRPPPSPHFSLSPVRSQVKPCTSP